MQESDLPGHLNALRVVSRHHKRRLGKVGRKGSQQRPVSTNCNDNSPTPSTYISHLANFAFKYILQTRVNHAFGLGTGHKNVACNQQVESVELAVASKIGNRLASTASLDQGPVS